MSMTLSLGSRQQPHNLVSRVRFL